MTGVQTCALPIYKEQSGTVIVVESETFGVVLEEVENENTADTAE